MSKIKVNDTKNQEKQLVDRIRTFQRSQAENKKCADCGEMGPTYVCSVEFYRFFICTVCSGIHRELNHKIKGISVSKWTPEEVEEIELGGTPQSNAYFMGNHRPGKDQAPPESNDPTKLREF